MIAVVVTLLILLALMALAFAFLPLPMAAIIAAVLAMTGSWIVAAEIQNRWDRSRN